MPYKEPMLLLLNPLFSDCGDPREGNPDLIHSDLNGTTLYGASAFFQCHTGYEGSGSATCSTTGDWGQLPTCSPKGYFIFTFHQIASE